MSGKPRSQALAERASYLYACSLMAVLYLFLPFGGYERMMEGKYHCFLLLTAAYLAAMLVVSPCGRPRFAAPPRASSRDSVQKGEALRAFSHGAGLRVFAAAYLAFSALSAVFSPYGAYALLGGTRRDGLVTLALYAASFYCLSRFLRPDRRLLYLAAAAVTLCDALALLQLAGRNPLWLYPDGLTYYDGDIAYAGFYAGVSGNADFTAFLLALAACVLLAALLREKLWALGAPLALTLYVLYRLGVSAAWLGIAFAVAWGLPLLFPRRKALMCAVSLLLSAAALVFVWRYSGANRTLSEASRLLHGDFDGAFGSGRLSIWQDCLPLVRQRPLFGGGPDTLGLRGLEPLSWFRDGAARPVDITAAHNEYLNILVNQGALALVAYLALLVCALARCRQHAEEPRYALAGAGLLAYAAMAFFSISTPITAPFVWLLLAAAASAEGAGKGAAPRYSVYSSITTS